MMCLSLQVCHMEGSIATRSKDATRAPGLTTRSKKLLGAPGIATRSKDAYSFLYSHNPPMEVNTILEINIDCQLWNLVSRSPVGNAPNKPKVKLMDLCWDVTSHNETTCWVYQSFIL